MAQKPTYEELSQRVKELEKLEAEHKGALEGTERLNRLNEALLGSGSLKEKLRLITDEIVKIFKADFARIWMIKPGDLCDSECIHAKVTEGPNVCRSRERCLHLLASSGRYTHIDGGHKRVPIGCFKIGKIAAEVEPKLLTNDVINDPRIRDHEWVKELDLVSFAGYRLLSTDGGVVGVLALFSKQAISSEENAQLESLAATTTQIIQTAEAEEALRESEEKYRTVLEANPDPVAVYDTEGKVLYLNPAFTRVFGWSSKKRFGKKMDVFVPDEAWPETKKMIDKVKAGEGFSGIESRRSTKAGNIIDVNISASIYRDAGGDPIGTVVNFRDITERKRLEKEIVGDRELLNNLISLCPDGIIGVNEQGKISMFNKAAEKLTLYKAADVIDKMSVADIYESLEKARFIKKKIYSPEHGGQGQLKNFETEIVTHAGNKLPIQLSATLLHKDGQEIGNVGFFHDISDRKQFEARLHDLSIRDSLSGLFNHRHFHSVLGEELTRTHRYKRPLSLICFDLDNFKQYNDKLGHLEGDNIIRLVGQYLKEIIRSADRAFRYGGDEFMILLPETIVANAHFVAEKIREHFNSSWPYEAVCKKYDLKPITLSLGVTEVNSEDGPETMIKRADLAMYEAKRAGGNRTVEAGPKIGKTT